MMEGEQSVLDFFAGGVPTFAVLKTNFENLAELLHVPVASDNRTVQELALIGVISYTEAFFKDLFGAVLNIFPEKILQLKQRGRDVGVELTALLSLEDPLRSKFGFLLSERFDFGTPRTVNALYKDALLITPFSADRVAAFDKVLAVRNLLVHHGGTLTTHFKQAAASQTKAPMSQDRTFYDSVVISKKQVGEAALLALDVAIGTVQAVLSRLKSEIAHVPPSDIKWRALEMLAYDSTESNELRETFSMLVDGASPYEEQGGTTDEDIPF
jgi:hypothetical protein